MSFNLGINVVEVEGQVPPSIVPAETSVAGFIVRSKRGIPGQVVPITSFGHFVEHFGAHTSDAFGAYALSGFFANGGTVALVTRIVSEDEPEEPSPPEVEPEAPEDEPEQPSSPETEPETPEEPTSTGGAQASHAQIPILFGTGSTGRRVLLTLTAAYHGTADPGSWGDEISVQVSRGTSAERIDLAVYYGDPTYPVELFEDIDLTGAPAASEALTASLTRVNSSSKYILLEVSSTNEPSTTALPASIQLTKGSTTSFPDDQAVAKSATAALKLFETKSIQLLACPETSDPGFVVAALAHCDLLGDRMFVGHVPLTPDGELTEAILNPYVNGDQTKPVLRGDKVYGALYGPNVMVLDPLGGKPLAIPPTGHVLGVYARTDRERGVWKAPAGDSARLLGVLNVTSRVNDVTHTRIVKQLGINLIRPITGKGIVLDSARTLSSNTKWLYVNVRLLFNFVKSSLKNNLRWVIGEPNDPNLWGRVKFDAVQPFLLGLWRAGAFGAGSPDQVFTIKIDGFINPPAEIEQGRLNVLVTFYPSRPAETIIVRVGQQMGASTASDA